MHLRVLILLLPPFQRAGGDAVVVPGEDARSMALQRVGQLHQNANLNPESAPDGTSRSSDPSVLLRRTIRA